MARPASILLLVVACFLTCNVPPAASRPKLLKPAGSYPPLQEAVINGVDDLLNQLLKHLLSENKEGGSGEDDSPNDCHSGGKKVRPLLPRPTFVPPVRPLYPDGSAVEPDEGIDTAPVNPFNPAGSAGVEPDEGIDTAPVKPLYPDGSAGVESHPGTRPVNSAPIVFPSYN